MASKSQVVGERIRERRNAAGLSQAELGRRTGVSQQSVAQWEKGVNLPEGARLTTLANELGVTVDELLGQRDLTSARLDVLEDRVTRIEVLLQDLARQLRAIERDR